MELKVLQSTVSKTVAQEKQINGTKEPRRRCKCK